MKMRYAKLEKFEDLVRLASTSILPILFYVERESGILCFSIAPLSLEDTILWYATFEEKPVPEYALFNAVDGTISFSEKPSFDAKNRNIKLIKIVKEDLLPENLV